MERYLFDGNKLIYHADRLNEFLEKGDCFPVYMEISPIGNCNHRCIFCIYDYIGYPDRQLELNILLRFIDEAAECGVRSLLYAGEGEPLLHPDIEKVIEHTKEKGIDAAIFTNGQLLDEACSRRLLPFLTFVRFSMNGGTKENYATIHRVKPEVFDTVIRNMEKAVELKSRMKLKLDIGVQYVLLMENIDHLINAIKILKGIGIDYVAIKPFVRQSDQQSYKMEKRIDLDRVRNIIDKAEALSDTRFKVVGRWQSFMNYGKKNYRHCYGTSFISVVNSAGEVSNCMPYLDKKEFVFGNIRENTFRQIWHGERRKKIKEHLEHTFDIRVCPPHCRPTCINETLWEIKNPSVKHLNFI